MRRDIPLKPLTWVLLVVMLAVMFNCVTGSAHALQQATTGCDGGAHAEVSASHLCPCAPVEPPDDNDGCDTCVNCVCHAPLTVQAFQLKYDPIVLELCPSDTFKHLPEVYLSKFIPPQLHV